MSETVKTILIAALSSSAFAAFVSGMMARRDSRRKTDDGIRAGVRMLLYEKIKLLGKQYIARGSIHSEELEDILKMHEIYHNDLGGNGFLDTLMYKVKKLPVSEE